MTDENAGAPNLDGTDPGGAPMMMVNAQYVKDLSFENPNAPQSLSQQSGEPNIQIAIDVNADQIADKAFEVTLTLRAEGTAGSEQLFIVEIVYAGIFSIGEVPDEYVPPLLVQPIDFMSLYQQRVAQMQAEGGEAAAPAAAGNGAGDKKDGDDKQKFEFEL